MKNAGLGGQGSVRAGMVKPSLPKLPNPGGNNSATPSVNMTPASKKNPMKQAEQTQNKDIKDIKMKEAQAQMKGPEMVKFDSNGQWNMSYDDSTDKVIKGATVNQTEHRGADINVADKQPAAVNKSGYKGYKDEDNVRRKLKNTGETTGIHTMDSIKRYGGSGASAANKEAKEMRRKSKKNPVKVFTPEEIATYNKKGK